MALKLLLLLNKAFYEPDEAMHATVQIINDAETSVSALVHQLSFQASGFERTDPNWIAKLYKQECKHEKSESRRRVRTLFSTENAILLKNSVLPHRAAQEFHLRLKLPAVLPPSFRGTSVRFNYLIEVKAVYELSQGDGLPALFETVTTSNFLVWPSASPRLLPSKSSQPGPSSSIGGGIVRAASSQPGALAASPSGSPLAGDGGAADGGVTPPAFGLLNSASPASPPSPISVQDIDNSLPVIEYRLQQTGVRVRYQEVPPEELTMALINSEAVAVSPMQFNHTNQLAGTHTPRSNTQQLQSASWKQEEDSQLATPSFIPAGIPPTLPGHHHHSGAPRPSAGPGRSSAGGRHRHHRHHHRHHHLPHGYPCSSDDSDDDAMPRSLQHQMSSSSYASAKGSQQQGQGSQQIQQQGSMVAGQVWGAPASGQGAGGGRSRPVPFLFGRTFILNACDQVVLRLSLQPPLEGPLQPGATFGCLLDFRRQLDAPDSSDSNSSLPSPVCCHQLLVLLETEEVVGLEFRSKGGSVANANSVGGGVTRKLYCEHQEVATDVAISNFMFTIPASATPSFRTPFVSLRWVLRFELTVGPVLAAPPNGGGRSMPARSVTPTQQLVWSLPLLVVAPVMPVR